MEPIEMGLPKMPGLRRCGIAAATLIAFALCTGNSMASTGPCATIIFPQLRNLKSRSALVNAKDRVIKAAYADFDCAAPAHFQGEEYRYILGSATGFMTASILAHKLGQLHEAAQYLRAARVMLRGLLQERALSADIRDAAEQLLPLVNDASVGKWPIM